MPITLPAKWRTSSKAELLTFTFFPSPQRFCLLFGLQTAELVSALTSKTSSKVYLLNDNTYWWVCVTIIVSFFGEIEQGVRYLLTEESIFGVELVYNSMRSATANVWKGEPIANPASAVCVG